MTARIKDVAEHAGVSSATVSRVLSNKPHVRNELKERVYKAVAELSYEPNRVARSLRSQRSTVIGLVISDIRNAFFNTVVRAIEDVAYKQGYAVFLCNSDENPEKELFYLNLLKAEKVAGVIISPARENASNSSSVINADIPIVAVDRRIPNFDMDSVLTNNSEASYQLISKLIAKGHKRIAAVISDLSTTTGRERFEGYKKAILDAGLEFSDSLLRSGEPIAEDGYSFTRDLLEHNPPPTALFTGNEAITLGALKAIYELGFKVPQDLELASFDKLDWIPFLPEMIYAEQPSYELGKQAAKLLFDRINGSDKEIQNIIIPSKIQYITAKKIKMVAMKIP